MPIKFRCQHCQQFLGISKSRAGAIVDCPQCGRNLRVPELNGRVRRMPAPNATQNSDSALISALSELSALDDSDSQGRANDVSDPDLPTTDSHFASEPTHSEAVTTIAVPERVISDNDSDSNPQAIPDEAQSIIEDDEAVMDSLAELAALDGNAGTEHVSESLLTEMRSVSQPISSTVAALAKAVLLVATGWVAGWYFGRSQTPLVAQPSSANGQQIAHHPNDIGAAKMLGATEQVSTFSGSVRYLTADGKLTADAGALVIALPRERKGQVKLSARSLHLATDHPDFKATLAMLQTYGGELAVANQRGHFRIQTQPPPHKEMVAVAVSRHRERAADLPISADIAQLIAAWFDSAKHFSGRLAVATAPLTTDSGEIEIQIGAAP